MPCSVAVLNSHEAMVPRLPTAPRHRPQKSLQRLRVRQPVIAADLDQR
ncbi:MAG: hypothetical protein ACKOTB_15920 [Planctomycetia bacterium]